LDPNQLKFNFIKADWFAVNRSTPLVQYTTSDYIAVLLRTSYNITRNRSIDRHKISS